MDLAVPWPPSIFIGAADGPLCSDFMAPILRDANEESPSLLGYKYNVKFILRTFDKRLINFTKMLLHASSQQITNHKKRKEKVNTNYGPLPVESTRGC